MEQKDLELRLLSGQPIVLKNIGEIYQPTLKQIVDISERRYNEFLGCLCLEIDKLDLTDDQKDEFIKNNISSFLIIISQCLQPTGEQLLETIKEGISFFLKKNVIFVKDFGYFFIGEKEELLDIMTSIKDIEEINNYSFLTEDNYEEFKEILMLQNCLKKPNEKFNPANEKAKRIIDKMKKNREKLNKAKSSDEKLDLSDLISSFVAYNKNVNISEVWNLTFYQFNDQFRRLQLINDYEISIQSILHGADSSKIDIKHFISKME